MIEPHRDSGEESLWDVGHEHTDEVEYSLEPVVTQAQTNGQTSYTKGHRHRRDEVDEVRDLNRYGSFCKNN